MDQAGVPTATAYLTFGGGVLGVYLLPECLECWDREDT